LTEIVNWCVLKGREDSAGVRPEFAEGQTEEKKKTEE
jgi:hypothetical protein